MRFLRDRATLWALWRWIMIILLKKDLSDRERLNVIEKIKGLGLDFSIGEGNGFSTVSLLGDVSHIDGELFRSLSGVMGVVPVSTRTPLATAAEGGGFFGGELQIIAGPCAVEGDGIFDLARAVKDCGVSMLRGGAYKPRTSPYSFAGLKREGIDLLVRAGREVGLPVVSELMGVRDIEDFADVDVIQIGARNMQNYELLKEVGRLKKPVLLKRGSSATVNELLLSAEYLLVEGATKVALCERGIKTFNAYTRNTLDLAAVPALKGLTGLPVVVDPSHGTGRADLVSPMALAAVAAGADGVMIEVHDNPCKALSDGAQAITPRELKGLVEKIKKIRKAVFQE